MKSNDPNSLKKKRRNRVLFYNILLPSQRLTSFKGLSWNPRWDIDGNDLMNSIDVALVALDFGKTV